MLLKPLTAASGDEEITERDKPALRHPTARSFFGINPGDFGRINFTSNNPRLIQLAVKFNF